MTGSSAFHFTLALMAALAMSLSATADAQDTATVHVVVTHDGGASADAWVTLTPEGGGAARDCHTENGACRIEGVLPGRYVVTATPAGPGRPPLPRVVPVPARVPSIEVRVRLL